MEQFVQAWGFTTQRWIDPKIEACLPKSFLEKRRKVSLPDLLEQLTPGSPMRTRILQDLDSLTFRTAHGPLDAVASGELSRAREMLRDTTPSTTLSLVEKWTVKDLAVWWARRRESSIAEYTLVGPENWRLLFPSDGADEQSRAQQLRTTLRAPDSEPGKQLWYRLFGLACLMSAGRRMSEIRNFWGTQLDAREFWTRTSQASFAHSTDALFAQVVTRYDLPGQEPLDATTDKMARTWSTMNRINQKGTRPQDKPVLLAELPTGDRDFIRRRLTPTGSRESRR